MITLTLPYPISANRYWASRVINKGGKFMALTYVTSAAKEFKEDVGWRAKAAGVRTPIAGRVAIDVKLYPSRPQDFATRMRKFGPSWDDTVMCLDLDNCHKVLLDAIKGVVIEDDKWVRRITSERMEPDQHPARMVVTIAPISIVTPQASLLEAA